MATNIQKELTADYYLVRYRVGPNQHGLRLDQFLKEFYRRRSREQIKHSIDQGQITVERNQGPHLQVGKLKPSSTLVGGDQVLVMSEKLPEPPVNFNYSVIYEDEQLFVIDKPPNLPVHPSGRYFFNTLLTHLKTKGGTGIMDHEDFFFLAHRIDKETSGILVLAKDSVSCANLVNQFAERKTQKKYLAITRGIPPETFECGDAMNRHRNSRISLKMECMPESEGGQSAYTSFKRLETRGNYALVECTPKTGRQHQIRVHLERVGFPILGDKLYGQDEDFSILFYDRERLTPEAEARLIHPRHALHSCELGFTHPKTGEKMVFNSPLPPDLREFFDKQR